MARSFTVVRCVLLAVSVAACFGDPGDPNDQVTPGLWVGTAGAGMTFIVVVDAPGSTISRIDVDWVNWVCGETTRLSGGTNVTNGGGWPISHREFDITIAAGIGESLRFAGTFASDNVTAAGTWSATVTGGSCSGEWTAHR